MKYDKWLKEDYDKFVMKRCERALLEDEEYLKLERNPETKPEELQAIAEMLCYKQCAKDLSALNKKK